jgi:hypothetical protein
VAPDSTPVSDANRYRIERLERDVHEIQIKLDDYGELKQTVRDLGKQVGSLASEFSGLRRALYTAALTIAGSTLLFAVSVLVAVLQ